MLCNDSTPAAEALCAAAPLHPYRERDHSVRTILCNDWPPGRFWYPIPQGAPCEEAQAAEAPEAAQTAEAHPDADTCRPG